MKSLNTKLNSLIQRANLSLFILLVLVTACLLPTLASGGDTPPSVILNTELNESGSCPFVYSWDGTDYQVDNDIYSVGRGVTREYTDYLALNNTIRPKDGAYSFEIREIPSEKSWTDTLKLIAIDHPASVRVGVDSSGNVHSYANPLPPDAATDNSGSDVMLAISDKNESGVPMQHNAAVTLDFSSVDISAGAKLVLRVNGFEGESKGDPTRQVPAIKVQTLESGEWMTRHSFFPKEFWAEGVFDLQPYLTESKSVRLLSVSCDEGKYHVLDYAALDNTLDDLTYEILEPASAVRDDGIDVLGKILDSDNIYAPMLPNNIIKVTFPFKTLTDEERSFVIVSEGYYLPVGNTYYIKTWDGSAWVTRASAAMPTTDTATNWDLSAYLPDPDGEYKVLIQNVLSYAYYAQVDFVSLTIDGVQSPPLSAMERDTTDILSLVLTSDDIKWNAVNNWAVLNFTTAWTDTTPPVVTPPADITVETTGILTPVTIGTATATDAVGVVSITSNAPASFPLGKTVVTWQATDAAGNVGTATQLVRVVPTPRFLPMPEGHKLLNSHHRRSDRR